MQIITSATTVSQNWDEAPSLFHVELTHNEITMIQLYHDMIKDLEDVASIDMRVYGQTWAMAFGISELEADGVDYFDDANEELIRDKKALEAIKNTGGIDKLAEFIANEVETQRVECMMVTIWGHGAIQFHATPKHCGDDMVVMSQSMDINDLQLDKIYIDEV